LCLLALAFPAIPVAAQDVPDAPPAEVAPPAEAPAETPAIPNSPGGLASLRDDQAILDRLELRVFGLPQPPPGSSYLVWLRSDDLATAEYAGDLILDANGDAPFAYTQPAGEALFVSYSQVLVTLEPSFPPVPPPTFPSTAKPGPAFLAGAIDPGAITQFRRLLVRWPDSRYGTASLQGVRQLALNAQLQAGVLREAAVNGDISGMRRKAEHLVNVMEGSRGGFYGDLDGNGRAEDPGDGVGLLPYIWGALAQTQFAWATAADERIAQASLAVQPPLQYALTWGGFVRDAGYELTQSQDPAGAAELSQHLFTAVQRIIAAVDPHGDPTLSALLAETAADTGTPLTPAYDAALGLVQVPLTPVLNAPTAGSAASGG
jgi:hypothetical protein